jgi:hypothetical protein
MLRTIGTLAVVIVAIAVTHGQGNANKLVVAPAQQYTVACLDNAAVGCYLLGGNIVPGSDVQPATTNNLQ